MKKNIQIAILGFCIVLLGGCYQMQPSDDALKTVPATNNPNFVPGSGLGMMAPSY